ncbi:MAG: inositol monophosphatase [Cytophagaceae bacterium]|nr:inositol monophosphatase [Cytophagaceae bacterium]MDW8456789.1 inositol monophosphatase family protein [Cytophagaceae bacterium]
MNYPLESICKQVVQLVRETGAFTHGESAKFNLSDIEYKGVNDLVSYVDKETEKKLVEGLKKILPQAGFITEEGTVRDTSEHKLKWVIDPLDGTTNFLHRVMPYSISVALMEEETLLVGVVYEMNLDECFYAWLSGGAWCNGKPIRVSNITSLNQSLVVTGFPYSLLNRENDFFEIIKHLVRETHGVRRMGSAAVDLCYVACGRFEAYFEFNLKIWDIAAGILIVQEAGGKVTDFSGGNDYLHGKELLASANVHSSMLDVIKKYWQ